ncbi:serine--tRNA synthetase-like protein Slimp [Hyposmocoma kahamanoa]|uniref:serine--tRNA synthetase-like protein Slimp n=1 Tax=Hyposmocoma kahamanoa TaxID=1477025 RepID=UPI000E6D7C71|nr:serine--tRNA synthetase-like protein Slimp [Hyposmocoma kahamanoa]
MLRKRPLKVIKRAVDCTQYVRYSALFINGAKATETFTYIKPHIDYPQQIKDRDLIQQNLIKRNSNIDLNKIEHLWSVYEELKQRKFNYDKKKSELGKELGKIINTEPESDIATKYKMQINLIKDNIRKLKEPLWSAEEAAIVEVLKLPNTLHPLTPNIENKVLYTYQTPPQSKKDHLKIGHKLNLLNFKRNDHYYLRGDAAIFELGAKFHFSNILRRNKFVQFSNPDFVKSVIVEGCGQDHTNPDVTFILHHIDDSNVNVDSRLHLTGGASLSSFLAYHAKNVLPSKVFPLKYFTMGRQYIPAPSDEDSLLHVSQSSVIQFFGATKTNSELDVLLHEVIEILKSIYCELNYHYRLSILPANKLHMWESLRVVVEMFSTSLNSYVEVANISVSGDFISKRLLLTYMENKESQFPHIISGTILNVSKFFGCVLEQDVGFSVPEQFRVENWSV